MSFSWIYPLIIKGYKENVNISDLAPLPSEMTCFNELNTISRNEHHIKMILIKAFYKPFGAAVMLSVLLVLSKSIAPALLLALIIDYMNDLSMPTWKGNLYALAMLLGLLIGSLCFYHGSNILMMLAIRTKTILVGLVYQKLLRLSSTSQRQFPISFVTNVVVIDSEPFLMLSWYAGIGTAFPVMVIALTYVLYQYVGVAAIVQLILMVALMPLISFLSNIGKTYQARHTALKDNRLIAINEMLNVIKIIKLCGWELAFQRQIKDIKNAEQKCLRMYAFWIALIRTVSLSAPLYTALIVFIVYIAWYHILIPDPKTLYVTLSLIYSTRMIYVSVPEMLAWLNQALISLKRVNAFLSSEELNTENIYLPRDKSVSVSNVSVSWKNGQQVAALQNISIKAEDGKLVAIIGKVGSGKTTLLKSILGEVPINEGGSIVVPKSIAYVPQTAWIQNATLKQNVLFVKPYEDGRYRKTIEACCLLPDIAILSEGDQTMIGERGATLSGGQKQRISIARAVYQDKDLYLFDDPLSALDSHVGVAIFDKVIGPEGLLARKTRILVTNNLVVLPFVDYIYVLDEGQLVFTGTFDQFKEKATTSFANYFSETTEGKLSDENPKSDTQEDETTGNSSTETIATGTISSTVIKILFKNIGLCLLITTITAYIATRVLEIISGVWLNMWTRDVASNSTYTTTSRLVIFGVLVLTAVFTLFIAFLLTTLGCIKTSRKLHNTMLKKILRSPLGYFERTPSGTLLNRFGNDVEQLDVRLANVASRIFDFGGQILGMLIFISIIIPYSAILWIFVLALYGFLQRLNMSIGRQVKRFEAVTRSNVCNHLSESYSGLAVIRAYNVSNTFTRRFEELVDANSKCLYNKQIIQNYIIMRLAIIGDLIAFVVVTILVNQQDTIGPGLAGLLITNVLAALFAFSFFVQFACDVEACLISAERIYEYCSLEPEAPWTNAETSPGDDWPNNGEIMFCNYSTAYPQTYKPVLCNLSLHIKPREKIGIVGRTGAGKSSFTLALFRILEACSGFIYIDGVDIGKIGLHDLRNRLTIIPQDPILFRGSLRVNLDPYNAYSDEEIWKAVQKAHLTPLFRTTGLDTAIEEGGSNLSVGQRQLVCLARAVLRRKKILIMDEATASVDVETDMLIQKTIREDLWDQTIITIAHRLQTVLEYDTIVVLDKGQICEKDSPAALLRNEKSVFYSMASKTGITADTLRNKKQNV